MTSVKIDLITLFYNPGRFLDRYFQALRNLDYPSDCLRVHLLDNSPDHQTYQYVKETVINSDFPYQIQIHKSHENLGFSGGNNYWFKNLVDHAEFPFFFLLNQDSEIDSQCLAQLSKAIQDYNDTGFLEARQSPKEHPKVYDPKTFETSWCSGGGLLIRKDALKDTGFFDHRFFLYCEDVDLSWRMWLKNWKCRICPDAKYKHITEEQDQEKDQSIRYFYTFRNGIFLHLKYDNFLGNFKYYILAFLVCFKQDSERRRAFLKAYFASFLALPYYLFKRLLNKSQATSKWIKFNRFEFGDRREFEDTPDGKRVFLSQA